MLSWNAFPYKLLWHPPKAQWKPQSIWYHGEVKLHTFHVTQILTRSPTHIEYMRWSLLCTLGLWVVRACGEAGCDRATREWRRGKVKDEWRESPEGSFALTSSRGAIIQLQSCSEAMAHRRSMSPFHPYPHLFHLPLIGSDWVSSARAKHS